MALYHDIDINKLQNDGLFSRLKIFNQVRNL